MPQNTANASASRESIRPSGTTCICQRTQNRGSVFAFLLLCSKCYAMDCLGKNCTHAQTCDNVRVQCATQWTENSFDHRWSPLCFLATIALESLMCQDGEDENPPWQWIQVQLTAGANVRKIAFHQVCAVFLGILKWMPSLCVFSNTHGIGNAQVQIWWQSRVKTSTNPSPVPENKNTFAWRRFPVRRDVYVHKYLYIYIYMFFFFPFIY